MAGEGLLPVEGVLWPGARRTDGRLSVWGRLAGGDAEPCLPACSQSNCGAKHEEEDLNPAIVVGLLEDLPGQRAGLADSTTVPRPCVLTAGRNSASWIPGHLHG